MKLLLKTVAVAAAIALGSASPAPAQLNLPILGGIDVCADLVGIQLNIGDCPPTDGGGGDGGLIDVCLDLPGIQLDILECAPDNGGGGGLVDVCLDLPGIQLDIGDCPPPGGGIDVCPNIPGVQTNPAACPPGGGTDVCPTIPGVQTNPAACPPGGPLGPIGGPNVDTRPLGAIGIAGGAQVCFFSAINFAGSSFCAASGASLPVLGSWNNMIRSINVPSGLSVQVCVNEGFTGQCTTVTTSLPQLFGGWEAQISSIRVM